MKLASILALVLMAGCDFRDPGPLLELLHHGECANLSVGGTILRACQPIPPSYDSCPPGQILVGDIPVYCVSIADYCSGKAKVMNDEVEKLRRPRVCSTLKARKTNCEHPIPGDSPCPGRSDNGILYKKPGRFAGTQGSILRGQPSKFALRFPWRQKGRSPLHLTSQAARQRGFGFHHC